MASRIYADFNALAGSGHDLALILTTLGTLKDLSFHQIRLSEGLKLTFWDGSDEEEDLEAETEVYFDERTQRWMAAFSREQLQYVPKRDRSFGPHLCFRCRTDLEEYIRSNGLNGETLCPSCGLEIWYPILPPEGVR